MCVRAEREALGAFVVGAGGIPTASTGAFGTLEGTAAAVGIGAVVSMGAGCGLGIAFTVASRDAALAAIGTSPAMGSEVTVGVGAVSRPSMKAAPTRNATTPT